ncbi:MAG TPA: AMP-binding protein [Caproiciproducens sp.]|nr:AMP-binding protein [Caproiciproducens sp.]
MQYVKDTLGSIVDRKCGEFKNREAMVFASDNIRLTYSSFRVLYDSLAKALYHLGIRKGHHIAIMSVNSPYWLALQIAAAKLGAVFVCLNTAYTENELEYVLNHSESTAVILASGHSKVPFLSIFKKICPELETSPRAALKCERLPLLKSVITDGKTPSPGTFTLNELVAAGSLLPNSILEKSAQALSCRDVVNIQYTSGTTGKPKAVLSTHYTMINNAIVGGKNMNYTPDDRLLLCLPLFHVIGCVLSGILALLYGSTLVIVERFQTDQVLELLEKEKCTAINAVPTMFHFVMSSPKLRVEKLPALRKGFIAGSYCPPALMQDIMTKLHIAELSNVYGQTEAIAITQTVSSDSLEHRLETIGRPLEGVEARIMDIQTHEAAECGASGELCVKSEYVMCGYLKNRAATEKAIDPDGWLHTGDLASMDREGYIRIMGRMKEIIIRGGENISPIEIEDTLKSYQGVKDAVAIGVPDSILGEEICALVIPSDPKLSLTDLLEYAKNRLARYKVPKYLKIVKEFPLTSNGKVQKIILKEQMIKEYALKK